jgi:hypothetical protein
LFKRLKPITLDGGVVNKDVGSALPFNKSKPLGIVEPFHFPSTHHGTPSLKIDYTDESSATAGRIKKGKKATSPFYLA